MKTTARIRPALRSAPRLLRTPVARGLKTTTAATSEVVRDGGGYGAGLIRGVAVLTRGEAIGHEAWIDRELLHQVATAINAAPLGIKSRFTHPGISADGLGRALGRIRSARVAGDSVRADLHLYESAHKTPDGDLAAYVMDLAAEDPAAFGLSIVFEPDIDAERAFVERNRGRDGAFKSPDPANAKNYPHARLKQLDAADMVDEPAANPSGLFHRGDGIAFAADAYLDYVLGLTHAPPRQTPFAVSPQRMRRYLSEYLTRHGIEIRSRALTVVAPDWKRRAAWRERGLRLERESGW